MPELVAALPHRICNFVHKHQGGAIMSRFLVAVVVGAAMTAAVSTSASAYHCLARSPNGATGTAFGIILERAQ
jgi:hypothetical protein